MVSVTLSGRHSSDGKLLARAAKVLDSSSHPSCDGHCALNATHCCWNRSGGRATCFACICAGGTCLAGFGGRFCGATTCFAGFKGRFCGGGGGTCFAGFKG
eukprot:6483490-Amphidinium_carterae.1